MSQSFRKTPTQDSRNLSKFHSIGISIKRNETLLMKNSSPKEANTQWKKIEDQQYRRLYTGWDPSFTIATRFQQSIYLNNVVAWTSFN